MEKFLNHFSAGSPGAFLGHSGRRAGWTGVAVVLALSSLACSEASSTSTPVTTGGMGGQVGSVGGTGVVAGTSNTPGGTSPASSGAAGTATGASGGGAGGNGGSGGASGNAGSGGSGGADDGWTSLFNGMNLDGWTPSAGHAGLFTVTQLDNEGVLHGYPTQVDQSDQPMATLRTVASFSSYLFYLEYKWGTKRYSDRKQTARDNGICFHLCNDPTQVWPESLEFQIGSQAWPGDWVTGNIFMLVNKTRAQWPYTMLNNQEVFSATGAKKNIGAPGSYYKALAPSNLDKPDDWNIIELTVHGSKDAEFKVNGTVVNQLFDMECDEGQGFKPLDRGPIALQAEWAEIYFRKIRIKVLP